MRKFTEVRKHSQYACCVPFSVRAEIPFRLHETFSDFQARLAGLEIPTWFENARLGFSARAELCPGLNPSPCNRQFGFQRICFRSRSEISAWDEIRQVIKPLKEEITLQKFATVFLGSLPKSYDNFISKLNATKVDELNWDNIKGLLIKEYKKRVEKEDKR